MEQICLLKPPEDSHLSVASHLDLDSRLDCVLDLDGVTVIESFTEVLIGKIAFKLSCFLKESCFKSIFLSMQWDECFKTSLLLFLRWFLNDIQLKALIIKDEKKQDAQKEKFEMRKEANLVMLIGQFDTASIWSGFPIELILI